MIINPDRLTNNHIEQIEYINHRGVRDNSLNLNQNNENILFQINIRSFTSQQVLRTIMNTRYIDEIKSI